MPHSSPTPRPCCRSGHGPCTAALSRSDLRRGCGSLRSSRSRSSRASARPVPISCGPACSSCASRTGSGIQPWPRSGSFPGSVTSLRSSGRPTACAARTAGADRSRVCAAGPAISCRCLPARSVMPSGWPSRWTPAPSAPTPIAPSDTSCPSARATSSSSPLSG